MKPESGNRYDHLRACAAAQKTATVERLHRAIAQLTAEGQAITAAAIVAVGGPSYTVLRRNAEAYAWYVQHSAFHHGTHAEPPSQETMPPVTATTRTQELHAADPLNNRKRSQLIQDLRAAWDARDQLKNACAMAEDRYQNLLSEHIQCGEMVTRLQAALVNDEFRKRIVDFATLEQREGGGNERG